MRKTILLAIFLLSSIPAMAEVTFFNKSHHHSVVVSYQFCQDYIDGVESKRSCDALNTVTVPKVGDGKNYISMVPPTDSTVLTIDSAEERDDLGNVVARGKYSIFVGGCGITFRAGSISINGAILLDDIEGSPIITCGSAVY